MAIYDENAIITTATTYFNNAKRYIRKKDMQIYHRTKSLSKSDMDFLEQFMLIHIKNIEKGSKIPQNFYAFSKMPHTQWDRHRLFYSFAI